MEDILCNNIKVLRFDNVPVPSNTYLLVNETSKKCIVIDPGSKEQAIDSISQQKPNIDSLLKTIVRPSEMELPIVWTDTIFDTCQTYYSSDKKFVAFIGETEEDAIRNSKYGIYSDCKEALFNSLFLHDIEGDTTILVFTASPEIGALSNPQIDSKLNLLYFLRGDIYMSKGFYRYDIISHETKFLTGSRDNLTYTLKPNGNIFFQDVSENVYICLI